MEICASVMFCMHLKCFQEMVCTHSSTVFFLFFYIYLFLSVKGTTSRERSILQFSRGRVTQNSQGLCHSDIIYVVFFVLFLIVAAEPKDCFFVQSIKPLEMSSNT